MMICDFCRFANWDIVVFGDGTVWKLCELFHEYEEDRGVCVDYESKSLSLDVLRESNQLYWLETGYTPQYHYKCLNNKMKRVTDRRMLKKRGDIFNEMGVGLIV